MWSLYKWSLKARICPLWHSQYNVPKLLTLNKVCFIDIAGIKELGIMSHHQKDKPYLVQLCNEKNTISLGSPCPVEYSFKKYFFKGDLIKVAAAQNQNIQTTEQWTKQRINRMAAIQTQQPLLGEGRIVLSRSWRHKNDGREQSNLYRWTLVFMSTEGRSGN